MMTGLMPQPPQRQPTSNPGLALVWVCVAVMMFCALVMCALAMCATGAGTLEPEPSRRPPTSAP